MTRILHRPYIIIHVSGLLISASTPESRPSLGNTQAALDIYIMLLIYLLLSGGRCMTFIGFHTSSQSQRKKDSKHKLSYIHAPTCGSLLDYGLQIMDSRTYIPLKGSLCNPICGSTSAYAYFTTSASQTPLRAWGRRATAMQVPKGPSGMFQKSRGPTCRLIPYPFFW